MVIASSGDNKPYKAYYILKECASSTGKYKFALTCIKLNKLQEAEKVLATIKIKDEEKTASNLVASIYYTQGMLAEKEVRHKEAYGFYQKCLNIDPTMWVAFERMCRFGTIVNANSIFNESHPFLQCLNNRIVEGVPKTPLVKCENNMDDSIGTNLSRLQPI